MLIETAAEVIYNERLKAVEIIWIDFATTEQFKKIMEHALSLTEKHKSSKLISDMVKGKAVTKESFFWFKTDFLPVLSRSGIKKFAYLVSGNTFRKLYADSLQSAIQNLEGEMKYFNNRTEMEQWC